MATDFDGSNYSETDASNNNASPNGMPEGMNPSGVNDSGRTLMGAAKRAFDRDHAGAWCAVGGTGNAITLTYTTAPTGYIQGQKYAFKATAANSGATTVNVNALGAKSLFKKGAAGVVACVGAEINTGDIVELEYDGTQFQITSDTPGASGTVTSIATAGLATGGPITSTGTVTVTGADAAATLSAASAVIALTPAGFAGNKSLGASGYYKLPGGFIIQWGTLAMGSGGTVTGSFPLAFPSGCYQMTASYTSTGNQAAGAITAGPISASQYTVISPSGTACNVSWIAIGI